jgi:hypothetical protein
MMLTTHTSSFGRLCGYGFSLLALCSAVADVAPLSADTSFKEHVLPFLENHCYDCHDDSTQKAEFAVHDIDGEITNGNDVIRWKKVLEMVTLEEMPPPKKPQPSDKERLMVTSWIEKELTKIGQGPDKGALNFPSHGNRVKHEALFSGEHLGPAYSKPRAWRISPNMLDAFASRVVGVRPVNGNNTRTFSQPFAELDEKNFKDYGILKADEGTIKVFIQTSRYLADSLMNPKSKGLSPDLRKRALPGFLGSDGPATDEELRSIMAPYFEHLFRRKPTDEEVDYYVDGLFRKNVELGGRNEALRYLLMGMMMSNEFVFRLELGLGKELPDGRRILAPRELGYALSYTLADGIMDAELLAAVQDDRFSTREDVEREARRILGTEDTTGSLWGYVRRPSRYREPFRKKTILRFFQEYFGYKYATSVFKDQPRFPAHNPQQMVNDADVLVLQTLKGDKDVLKTLLTTNEYYLSYRVPSDVLAKGKKSAANEKSIKKQRGLAGKSFPVYSIEPNGWEHPVGKPYALPKNERAGLLTHPAWLVSYSGNFETDPVRRGKWIQERLLGGIVPDVPIGVDAQVPEDHNATLRERFAVVDNEKCWRCHKKMNPYGNVFEAYDDFGRFRERELLGDPMVPPNAQSKYKQVDKSTVIKGASDPALNGEYRDAIELMHKLADSERVRQTFIRHIFRYFLGRNEMLSDSPTLMAMDATYVKSGGSFNETLVTLLISDSFLYRK